MATEGRLSHLKKLQEWLSGQGGPVAWKIERLDGSSLARDLQFVDILQWHSEDGQQLSALWALLAENVVFLETLQYAWSETQDGGRSTFTDQGRKALQSGVSKIVLPLITSYVIGVRNDLALNNAHHAPSELNFEACVRVGGNQRPPNWEKWEAVIVKYMSSCFLSHVATLMAKWRT